MLPSARSFVVWLSMTLCAAAAQAQGPLGDYGEAPGGGAGLAEAYPGVLARFVSFYSHTPAVFGAQHDAGTWLNPGATVWLGERAPDLENDSRQDAGAPDNDAAPVLLLEGLGPNPLATLLLSVAAGAGHDRDTPVYLNVFIDQNRDGQWKDGFAQATPLAGWNLEWVVQDLVLDDLRPSETTEVVVSQIRLEAPRQSHWLRLVVSDLALGEMLRPRPADGTAYWDATVPAAHAARGEVEDFLLEFFVDPSQMTRGGIALRSAFAANPPVGPGGPLKPACILSLRKIAYAQPFGVNQPFVVYTDWCESDGNGTDFGLEFRVTDVADGCSADDAVVGMFGPRYLNGVRLAPRLRRRAGAPAEDLPYTCSDGTELDLPDPSDLPREPDSSTPLHLVPRWDGSAGHVAVDSLRSPAQHLWNACYPKGRGRYRLYDARVVWETCGCRIRSARVRPGPAFASALSLPGFGGLGGLGGEAPAELFNGDLIEEFVDPGPGADVRPFPDLDFTKLEPELLDPIFGFGALGTSTDVGVPDFTAPSSFRLNAARYVTEPRIPSGARAVQVSFWHLCEAFEVILEPFAGAPVAVGPEVCSLTEWQQKTIDLPVDFQLRRIKISMFDGYLDELVVRLAPPIADCDGDGISDAAEIGGGSDGDCDFDGVPDSCQLADDDCDRGGVLDRCEVAAGAPDANGDGVPDSCLPPAGSQCVASPTSLCLAGGRFRVEAQWRTPSGESGPARAEDLTDDTGYLWFFRPENVEAIVKVLDACVPPFDRYWVFASGLTNVEVTLTVTDTLAGASRTYVNPLGTPFRPVQDTGAFATCGPAASPIRSAVPPPAEVAAELDQLLRAVPASAPPVLAGLADCVPTATDLCLNAGRFRVRATWTTPQGTQGTAQGVPISGDTGYFWFFRDENIELVVKVLDACVPPFDRFWVFAAGLTNVGVTLEVTDTVSGQVRTYVNPIGTGFQPLQDTDAFATCP